MTRATRLALAATFGRFPHGPLHIPRRLPDGRVQVGCDQCGATETAEAHTDGILIVVDGVEFWLTAQEQPA